MLTRPFFLLPGTISKIPIRTINFSKFSENLSVPSSQCLTVCYKQYGQIVTDCGNSLSFYDRFEVKRDDRSLRVLLSFHTVMDDRLQVKRSLAILIAVYTWENMFSDKNVKKEFQWFDLIRPSWNESPIWDAYARAYTFVKVMIRLPRADVVW